MPLLDLLLDREKLRNKLLDQARGEIRTHVVGNVLDSLVRPRVDEVLGRVRRK